MGCCYSCDEDRPSQNGEPNERTHLLVDPVSNNTDLHVQRLYSNDYLLNNQDSAPKKTDEQSALNRILQETASNVIDVAALDSHTLEQHEYTERIRQYMMKVHQQFIGRATLPALAIPCLLTDIPTPEKILAAPAIGSADWDLINEAVTQAAAAVADLKVEHKVDLVVPFRIP